VSRYQIDPRSAAHLELKTELEELVQLSRDLITEFHNTHVAAAPKHKTSSIAQMAAKQSANQVTEAGRLEDGRQVPHGVELWSCGGLWWFVVMDWFLCPWDEVPRGRVEQACLYVASRILTQRKRTRCI